MRARSRAQMCFRLHGFFSPLAVFVLSGRTRPGRDVRSVTAACAAELSIVRAGGVRGSPGCVGLVAVGGGAGVIRRVA
jgi:hypothetical protein